MSSNYGIVKRRCFVDAPRGSASVEHCKIKKTSKKVQCSARERNFRISKIRDF